MNKQSTDVPDPSDADQQHRGHFRSQNERMAEDGSIYPEVRRLEAAAGTCADVIEMLVGDDDRQALTASLWRVHAVCGVVANDAVVAYVAVRQPCSTYCELHGGSSEAR